MATSSAHSTRSNLRWEVVQTTVRCAPRMWHGALRWLDGSSRYIPNPKHSRRRLPAECGYGTRTSAACASGRLTGHKGGCDSQELVRISSRLGIDPKHDVDLAWVVNEYLSSPLPGEARRAHCSRTVIILAAFRPC